MLAPVEVLLRCLRSSQLQSCAAIWTALAEEDELQLIYKLVLFEVHVKMSLTCWCSFEVLSYRKLKLEEI
jgi:hypothetical protein